MNDLELRVFPTTEVRAEESDDGDFSLRGYFTRFEAISVNLGGFVERIAPTAFRDDLDAGTVVALWNHDSGFVLGNSGEARTLSLAEDKVGNTFDISLADTQLVRDRVLSPVQRKDVSGVSFGFRLLPGGDTWEELDDGRLLRTVTKASLKEVSPGVAFPAYPDNHVAAAKRSLLDAWLAERGDSRDRLRRAKLRQRAAILGVDMRGRAA